MNRRNFIRGLGTCIGALPVMPGSVFASLSSRHPAYLKAEHIVRKHGSSSSGMLSQLLKIDPADGIRLFDQLVTDCVLSRPDGFGIAWATRPLPVQHAFVANKLASTPTTQTSVSQKGPRTTIDNVLTDDDPRDGTAPQRTGDDVVADGVVVTETAEPGGHEPEPREHQTRCQVVTSI